MTQNFTIEELVATSIALDNTPTEVEVKNLKKVCTHILQPLRDYMQRPIIVTSGYRSPAVNSAVGGSPTSGHMLGTAADITLGTRALNKMAFEYIRDNLPFRQLINEYNYQWIHIEYREGDNKGQVLKIG